MNDRRGGCSKAAREFPDTLNFAFAHRLNSRLNFNFNFLKFRSSAKPVCGRICTSESFSLLFMSR